jgi:integrase
MPRRWGRGSVRREASGSWSIRWPESGTRRFRGGFPSKHLAERALAVQLGRLAYAHAGVEADPRSLPTLGELAKDFLQRRKVTHRAGVQDEQRWKLHVGPTFDHLRPTDVNLGVIRRWVDEVAAGGQSPSSISVMVACLSGLYSELQEDELVAANPFRGLPPTLRRKIRSLHDPATVPFVEKLADVRRIFDALPERVAILYALGAYAGLRPGEARALEWSAVDLERRVLHVRVQAAQDGPRETKGKRARPVPVNDALLPILTEWKVRTGGKGIVAAGRRRYVYRGTPNAALSEALGPLELARPGLGWYQATRHTYASHYVLGGGTLEELQTILGHATLAMTQRYAHLRHDLFRSDRTGIMGSGRGLQKRASVRKIKGTGVV